MSGMKLEIGAGATRRPGFLTLDADPATSPDIVADAGKIPLADDDVTELVAINVLEHVEWSDVRRTLAEWGRVVRAGGTLEIHVPDIDFVPAFFRDNDPAWNSPAVIGTQPYDAGEDRWAYINHFVMSTAGGPGGANRHRSIFNLRTLTMLLCEIGCEKIERLKTGRWLHVRATMGTKV